MLLKENILKWEIRKNYYKFYIDNELVESKEFYKYKGKRKKRKRNTYYTEKVEDTLLGELLQKDVGELNYFVKNLSKKDVKDLHSTFYKLKEVYELPEYSEEIKILNDYLYLIEVKLSELEEIDFRHQPRNKNKKIKAKQESNQESIIEKEKKLELEELDNIKDMVSDVIYFDALNAINKKYDKLENMV